MNTNTGGIDYRGANCVEIQVLEWLNKMLGFMVETSGVPTSCCSAANLIGLAAISNI